MNYANILTSTHAAIATGADTDKAARAGFRVIAQAKATVESLLAADRESMVTQRAVDAAGVTIAAGLRVLLASEGVDTASTKPVRDALRERVWKDEGATMPEAGSAKPEDGSAERKVYDRVAQRLSRLAKAIVGAEHVAPERVAVKVPRAAQSSIDELVAQFGAAAIREALKRAAAKAK